MMGAYEMKVYEFLGGARSLVTAGDWTALEDGALDFVKQLIPDDRIAQIDSVDVELYEQELASMLKSAEARAAEYDTKALYWEFDLDNDWDSSTFFCTSYTPDDPEWAADFDAWVEGPSMRPFANLFAEFKFSGSPEADGTTTLLVARTLAAFGRSYDAAGRSGYPFGAAFHDSSDIMMMPLRA